MLKDRDDVLAYLIGKGWVSKTAAVSIEPLTGGVSSDVWRIRTDEYCWVLKRALAKLKVEAEWHSDVARIEREQEAMLALSDLMPDGSVPRIVHRDPQNYVYVMTCAPSQARSWKDNLMQGEMRPSAAGAVGGLLRRLHEATAARSVELRPVFSDTRYFDELRIDPFHRYVAERHPDLRSHIDRLIHDLLHQPSCLVHGDYSPKNILITGDDRPTLLDYEVAHWGNPVFDQAFCCAHLMLKGWFLSRGDDAATLMRAFLKGYGSALPGLIGHLGLMLLARVDGKSPAPYLTNEGLRARVRRIGASWLRHPAGSIGDLETVVDLAREALTA